MVLHATLDYEDGFHVIQSKIIGEYLHRRVYSGIQRSMGAGPVYCFQTGRERYNEYQISFPCSRRNFEPIKIFVSTDVPKDIDSAWFEDCIGKHLFSLTPSHDESIIRLNCEYMPHKIHNGNIHRIFDYQIEHETQNEEGLMISKQFKVKSEMVLRLLHQLCVSEPSGSSFILQIPPTVGTSLAVNNTRVFRSWHVSPYFSKIQSSMARDFSFESIDDCSEEFLQQLSLHVSQDEQLLPGMSFTIQSSPFSKVSRHNSARKDESFFKIFTGGNRNVITDKIHQNRLWNKKIRIERISTAKI